MENAHKMSHSPSGKEEVSNIQPKIGTLEKDEHLPKLKKMEDEQKMFQQYENSLQNMAESLKINNPQSYNKAQDIGLHMMESEYDLVEGYDQEGERIQARLILQTLENGLYELRDLSDGEKESMKKYYLEAYNHVQELENQS